MTSPDILKKYVCTNPFNYLDVQPTSQWICCPSWAPTNIRLDKNNESTYQPVDKEEDLLKNWRGPVVTEIRKSVLDGSYRHCDHKVCPSLSQLINTGVKPHCFVTKEKAEELYGTDVDNYQGLPTEVLFGYDRSCNLKCPSCRSELVPNDDKDSKEHDIKLFLTQSIEKEFSSSIKKMLITGSGDPFYSKIYRDYLVNFDATKYPELEEIQIITNGQLLNEKMWNSLKARPFIKTIEISIDAGTKHTYEQVTRLNGDWDRLLDNIRFLSTQQSIKTMIFSMVVSEHNYTEMLTFYNLLADIFKDSTISTIINFRQLVHWDSGAYSIAGIRKLSVFDSTHPKFENFLDELKKIHGLPRVSHNFHHLLR